MLGDIQNQNQWQCHKNSLFRQQKQTSSHREAFCFLGCTTEDLKQRSEKPMLSPMVSECRKVLGKSSRLLFYSKSTAPRKTEGARLELPCLKPLSFLA